MVEYTVQNTAIYLSLTFLKNETYVISRCESVTTSCLWSLGPPGRSDTSGSSGPRLDTHKTGYCKHTYDTESNENP